MKAQDAKKMSDAANTASLPEIYTAIETYAGMGDYRMHIYYLLNEDQKDELIERGFAITDHSKADEICIEISWQNI